MREASWRCTLLLILLYGVQLNFATVFLLSKSVYFPDLPAKFAAGFNDSRICGALYAAHPLNACSSLRKAFEFNKTEAQLARFALIVRGDCSFEDKIRNAQIAGFRAAIVFDDRDEDSLVRMKVNPDDIKVHAVFVSKATGQYLTNHALGEDGECCIYPTGEAKAWTVLAISIFSMIVVFGFLMSACFAPRPWLHLPGRNHVVKRIDRKMVETFPQFTFSPTSLSRCHNNETCVICLEDYREGEVLRLLPCQHAFHSNCVDSWLTNWGTCCPVCKLDIRSTTSFTGVKRGSEI